MTEQEQDDASRSAPTRERAGKTPICAETEYPDRRRVELMFHSWRGGYARIGGWAIATGFGAIAIGAWPLLIGLDLLAEESPENRAIALACGGLFVVVGLVVIVRGALELFRSRRRKALAIQYPHEPWRADHFWTDTGAQCDTLGQAASWSFSGIAFLAVPCVYFISARDWVAVVEGLLVAAIGAVGLWILCKGTRYLLRWIRFGTSTLRFEAFPYLVGETLVTTFTNSRGIGRTQKLEFRLRCIDVVSEPPRHSNTNETIVAYRIYEDRYAHDMAELNLTEAARIPVSFALPVDAKATAMSRRLPTYWELIVRAAVRGIDFEAVFLVPVYAAPDAEAPM